MQSFCLLPRPSSTDRGGGLFLPPRNLVSFLGTWPWHDGRNRRASPVAAAVGGGGGGEQDHYAVLGIAQSASSADIKRAYRLLARKYHPDVSRDIQAGEVFKSIHYAYQVLSDEVSRGQYDMSLQSDEATEKPLTAKWRAGPEHDEREYYYRWSELRRRFQHEKQKKDTYWYHRKYSRREGGTMGYDRGSFADVLRFSFFALFFMQTIGCRAALTLCGLMNLLDKRLDAGYKIGYMLAWLLGGRAGILLTLCINFTSWLCGKNSSSLLALVIIAMWVGVNVARFAPLPQGAVLALLYMSIKLQADVK